MVVKHAIRADCSPLQVFCPCQKEEHLLKISVLLKKVAVIDAAEYDVVIAALT